MSAPFSISLPYPPSGNNSYTVVRGRKILSKRGREYRDVACAAAALQRNGTPMLTERLSVAIALFPPDRRRRDIDSPIKQALDVLTRSGAIADDSLIDELLVTRCAMVDGGRIVVTVTGVA